MPLLARLDLSELTAELKRLKLDGWLIYDFRQVNPIARRVVGAGGIGSRRLFVWLPATGKPVAVGHKIELQPLEEFPGDVRPYATWQELHTELGKLIRGKRIAVEWSPEDQVPYLDRLPAGVVGLLEKLGATIVSSEPLVSRFAARWTDEELSNHRIAAEHLAEIARTTLAEAVAEVGRSTEYQIQQRVLKRIADAGLFTTHPPIVGFGANAANPHYEPGPSSPVLQANQVILLDLWGGVRVDTVYADQTWMGFSGTAVPDRVQLVWRTVRDARDAAVRRCREAFSTGETVRGRDLDMAARQVITERGFGDWFVHRTGHSIDTDLHGSGPHLDSYETDDARALIVGIGFSVEPGVYLTGDFGVRSEINVVIRNDGPEVTPKNPQVELILPQR